MHELSIAQSLVETVIRERRDRHLGVVRGITVRVGELTDVYPEALEFGYKMAIQGTELAESVITIEIVPLSATCNGCHRQIRIEKMLFICPECGSPDVNIERGLELDIAFIEVDDEEESVEGAQHGQD
jgi:hydrogenase nickel incorporation protein HypA/HybF